MLVYDIQTKDDSDRDKTPVADEKISTVSRLESKYSEVLGRRRHKEQREREDRDKTLEPDKTFVPLTRSATAIISSGAITKKDSSAYRLNRNYSDRKPTLSSNSTNSYKPRSDLNISQLNVPSSFEKPKTNYYESPIMRHKDSVYDIYGTRIPNSSRYNDFDSFGRSTRPGYYEGRDKESTFKSKYEPSRLYAELNNNETFNRNRNIPRHQKEFRRTATTNYNNYNHNLLDVPSTSCGYRDRKIISSSRYAPEKSSDYHRSQTQKFFDSEKSPKLHNSIDDEPIRSKAAEEREARRKEIQGLIAKYAQIDDIFLRAIDNNTETTSSAEIHNSIKNDYNCLNSIRANGSVSDGPLSDFRNNNARESFGENSHPHTQISRTSFLPLSKTQSVSSISSANRTRIPNTLSTFVRRGWLFITYV